MNYNFEWDPNKAVKNTAKHKITFESATSVFKDKNSISLYDESHSETKNEDRWITIGLDFETRTLIVIHTFMSVDKDNCNIRLISARKATKNEIKIYEEG